MSQRIDKLLFKGLPHLIAEFIKEKEHNTSMHPHQIHQRPISFLAILQLGAGIGFLVSALVLFPSESFYLLSFIPIAAGGVQFWTERH
ncbi:MAG TPA: hypothetical protein VF172_03505, partial [Nitrososphaera sp.]